MSLSLFSGLFVWVYRRLTEGSGSLKKGRLGSLTDDSPKLAKQSKALAKSTTALNTLQQSGADGFGPSLRGSSTCTTSVMCKYHLLIVIIWWRHPAVVVQLHALVSVSFCFRMTCALWLQSWVFHGLRSVQFITFPGWPDILVLWWLQLSASSTYVGTWLVDAGPSGSVLVYIF